MFKKIRFVLLLAALVAVGANSGGFGGVLGWFALVYVLWRAFPSIVNDFRGLSGFVGGSRLGSRARGVRPNNTL